MAEKKATADSRLASLIKEESGSPPPYSSQPSSTQASSSNLEAGGEAPPLLENLDLQPSPLELPTAAECLVHLKLLHAFAKLRSDIGNEEGLFGIDLDKFEDAREDIQSKDAHQPDGVHREGAIKATAAGHELSGEEKAEATLKERIREKRWTVFVTKAVDRFEKWWDSLSLRGDRSLLPLRTTEFETQVPGGNLPFKPELQGLDDVIRDILPPLDILMVWHSYLLSPRIYFEDCLRLSRSELWRTPFPWKLINEAIDNDTYEYTAPTEAIETFNKSLDIPWDTADDSRPKTISCPKCLQPVSVPWTRPPATTDLGAIEAYLINDTGFAGHLFEACPGCEFTITHEKLRVGKFIKDSKALSVQQRPLPGTILNSAGFPQLTDGNKKLGTHDPFFPNRVLEKLSEFKYSELQKEIETLSIEVLKARFENTMRSSWSVKTVNSAQYKPELIAKESKTAVRKMLSHYWDNASPFGIDLVGAVLRQGTFVLKMRKIDWLHSPAAMVTMQRLIVKYHRFIRIIADNPRMIAVPTLDVDLAWVRLSISPFLRLALMNTAYTPAHAKDLLHIHKDGVQEIPQPR